MFNTDYWVIGYYEAEKELKSYDTFHCIGVVQEYEKEMFGESFTDLGESEKVLNMYIYIVGEMILQDIEVLSNNYDEDLTKEMITEALEELENI
jgi:hypothetical protein